MFQKISKTFRLLKLKRKYPDVVYYGGPWFLQMFSFHTRPRKKGFFSQLGQDELVFTELFEAINSPKFPRLFVDVGCNHPMLHSNSYFFECNQGFEVLAIDALQEVESLWREHRPGAEFVQSAVGTRTGEIRFDVVKGGAAESMFSAVSGASQKNASNQIESRTVQVRRLSDILSERNIERVGILSMDIEGYEYEALLGLDFTQIRPYILIIENNASFGLGSDQVRDLLIGNGYGYFARIWNLDDIFVHRDLFDSKLAGSTQSMCR